LCLDSLLVAVDDDGARGDLARLRVPLAGGLTETGDVFEPYRLVDAGGQPVVAVAGFLRSLQAAGRSEATQRSYGMDLLRWFRFTWAAGFAWDQATRAEARDFCRWLQLAGKPERDHWRTGRPAGPGSGPAAGTVNAVTGKASPLGRPDRAELNEPHPVREARTPPRQVPGRAGCRDSVGALHWHIGRLACWCASRRRQEEAAAAWHIRPLMSRCRGASFASARGAAARPLWSRRTA